MTLCLTAGPLQSRAGPPWTETLKLSQDLLSPFKLICSTKITTQLHRETLSRKGSGDGICVSIDARKPQTMICPSTTKLRPNICSGVALKKIRYRDLAASVRQVRCAFSLHGYFYLTWSQPSLRTARSVHHILHSRYPSSLVRVELLYADFSTGLGSDQLPSLSQFPLRVL